MGEIKEMGEMGEIGEMGEMGEMEEMGERISPRSTEALRGESRRFDLAI